MELTLTGDDAGVPLISPRSSSADELDDPTYRFSIDPETVSVVAAPIE
ncbi:MAG: hypothetical protein AAFP04_04505 [Myxococcota bacterium]